ncbi:protein SPA1-RELATED 3-like isoform X1 [Brassica napus]|uniref:Protein kinase domain-containing protein n=2 Tax=Brassica TaxID=3705 RepID=A0A0D3CJY4_BRAOL|nr:PREDICTED: protein SPA1-RELATED 3-like [Brassica oleracea var. oleracea]XP_013696400.2 protein SPA1-RELATED 3-like isoform X1 [Brassica napus]
MEDSSNSNSRGFLNTSGVSDRNTEFSPLERVTPRSKPLSVFGSSAHKSSEEDSLGIDDPFVRSLEWGDVSLRQWLDKPERCVDVFECLHVFRQIVEIVNVAHSQGIVVHNVRPSCFVMSSFNHVSFIESASCSDSGSADSLEDGPVSHKKREDAGSYNNILERQVEKLEEEKKQPFPMKHVLAMETSWYTSPEEEFGSTSTCASDVYRLGVLLFELFCPVPSREDKSRTMSSLRHRVLPPQILLKCPKEASFCLWLLHPEPSCRPSMSDLLQSEFMTEPRDNLEEREAAIELRDKIEEQESLLEFLLMIQQRKQESAYRLRDTVSLLSSDIEQVAKRQLVLKQKGSSYSDLGFLEEPSTLLASRKRFRQVIPPEETDDEESQGRSTFLESSRLMRNFKKLETVYFLTRRRQLKAAASGKSLTRHSPLSSENGRGSEKSSVSNSAAPKDLSQNDSRQGGWIDPFLEGLCKYLSFSKLRVKADLKQGDLLNSSNLVCSLAFDRDGEFFATAGVNKKIKIFECDSIVNNNQDIHYPVVELASRSKLSSVCWNSYIKSQIASSNFEGVVQIWDVGRSQLVTEMKEHKKRVWSINISSADPTLLASGSDDGTVKLWSINQGASIGTIKTKANVCCVQFPSDSGRSLAFGSADHKVYYYDLRNPKIPLSTMVGHGKTVSYVKFVDSSTLVSSSTDNTLKLWDLSMSASGVNETPLHSFAGHTNLKNFVGLSVSDGYIATGSETNEVFVYHKAFPMPVMSYMFSNTDSTSGLEVDDASQFISSICWRGLSSTLVAANSNGNIKILEMVA